MTAKNDIDEQISVNGANLMRVSRMVCAAAGRGDWPTFYAELNLLNAQAKLRGSLNRQAAA